VNAGQVFDVRRVFEYIVLLWDGKKHELVKQFRLKPREYDAVVLGLWEKDLVEVAEPVRFGFMRRRCVKVIDSEAARKVMAKYKPSVLKCCGGLLFRTEVDVLADLASEFPHIPVSKLASFFKCPIEQVIEVAKTLHEKGVLTLSHRGARSTVSRPLGEGKSEPQETCGTTVAKYRIVKDAMALDASLVEYDGDTRYYLGIPAFRQPTEAVLNAIYERAAPDTLDVEAAKERLKSGIRSSIDETLSFVGKEARDAMASELCNRLHLGRLEYLLSDPNIEEVRAQGDGPVFVKHIGSRQEWVETNVQLSEDEILRYAKAVARETGQQVDVSHPLMDAILHTNDRVNVSLPEAAGGSTIMEIRVFSKRPWNFVRLAKRGTVDADVLAFLWLALEHKLNVLVSGEAGSGKTSFITALALFLGKNDHIVSVEDTRELRLPGFFRNWSHMTVRRGNREVQVTMSRLLLNALRMDPSYIIMGEVRDREDILALMSATAMGHPVMSTIHTRDCSTTVKRFMDAGVSASDLGNIHLNVILEAVKSKEDAGRPRRRVKEVGEYLASPSGIEVNRVFRLDMGSDRINPVNEPRLFFQRVMERVNMSKEEIRRDLQGKADVIRWLVRRDVEDIEVLGRAVQSYYRDRQSYVAAARNEANIMEVPCYEG